MLTLARGFPEAPRAGFASDLVDRMLSQVKFRDELGSLLEPVARDLDPPLVVDSVGDQLLVEYLADLEQIVRGELPLRGKV